MCTGLSIEKRLTDIYYTLKQETPNATTRALKLRLQLSATPLREVVAAAPPLVDEGEELPDGDTEGGAAAVELPSPLAITHTSPVESLLIKSLPWLSQARPTGRKQPFGHFELSWLVMISIAAVVLFAGWTGDPFANSTTESLYPTG